MYGSRTKSKTFHEFMNNILDTTQNYSITNLFKIATNIWKNNDTEYFIDENYKIYYRNNMMTKLVYNDLVWYYILNEEDVSVDIYYGPKTNPSKKKIQLNDIEQCQCYIEKQIILKHKKGYTYEEN